MTETLLVSDLAKAFEIDEVPDQIRIGEVADASNTLSETKLKSETLPLLIWLFIFLNASLIVIVTSLSVFENYLKWPNVVITDKVMIALISGATVQAAAIIIAAYKGLFG